MSDIKQKRARSGFNVVTHGIQALSGLAQGKFMGREITDMVKGLQTFVALRAGDAVNALKKGAECIKAVVHHIARLSTPPFADPAIDPVPVKPGRGHTISPRAP